MGRTRRLARSLHWYVAELMGDTHYRRYLAHRLSTHPDEPVLSEADYWRMRHRLAETSPTSRCC